MKRLCLGLCPKDPSCNGASASNLHEHLATCKRYELSHQRRRLMDHFVNTKRSTRLLSGRLGTSFTNCVCHAFAHLPAIEIDPSHPPAHPKLSPYYLILNFFVRYWLLVLLEIKPCVLPWHLSQFLTYVLELQNICMLWLEGWSWLGRYLCWTFHHLCETGDLESFQHVCVYVCCSWAYSCFSLFFAEPISSACMLYFFMAEIVAIRVLYCLQRLLGDCSEDQFSAKSLHSSGTFVRMLQDDVLRPTLESLFFDKVWTNTP